MRETGESIGAATIVLALVALSFCFSSSSISGISRQPITVMMQDKVIRQKISQCREEIESGISGWKCKSSVIQVENCVLKCLSPACYELIYESDPLEEGENDIVRSKEYQYCMHRVYFGESIEGVKGSFEH